MHYEFAALGMVGVVWGWLVGLVVARVGGW